MFSGGIDWEHWPEMGLENAYYMRFRNCLTEVLREAIALSIFESLLGIKCNCVQFEACNFT